MKPGNVEAKHLCLFSQLYLFHLLFYNFLGPFLLEEKHNEVCKAIPVTGLGGL
jgi:hypothetical protein